ncbi:hypothetical protein HD806DRAFT_489280, partial [Xylariaceae sp. AK1471]
MFDHSLRCQPSMIPWSSLLSPLLNVLPFSLYTLSLSVHCSAGNSYEINYTSKCSSSEICVTGCWAHDCIVVVYVCGRPRPRTHNTCPGAVLIITV